MANEDSEHWEKLCEQAAKEANPQNLTDLIYQIHCLLREKEMQAQSAEKPRQVA